MFKRFVIGTFAILVTLLAYTYTQAAYTTSVGVSGLPTNYFQGSKTLVSASVTDYCRITMPATKQVGGTIFVTVISRNSTGSVIATHSVAYNFIGHSDDNASPTATYSTAINAATNGTFGAGPTHSIFADNTNDYIIFRCNTTTVSGGTVLELYYTVIYHSNTSTTITAL